MKTSICFGLLLFCVLFSAQTIIAQYDQVAVKNFFDENPDDKMKDLMSKEDHESLRAFMSIPREFTLTYSNGISLYKEEEVPEEEQTKELNFGDDQGMISFAVSRSKSENQWYKDFEKQEVISKESIFDKAFLIEEKMNIIDWKIEEEEKQIGDFHCKKATALFNGENVVAFFTEEIPVPDGPMLYYGLPGLIIELNGESFSYALTSLSMIDENMTFEKPKEGKQIEREKFEKLKKEKTKKVETTIIMQSD